MKFLLRLVEAFALGAAILFTAGVFALDRIDLGNQLKSALEKNLSAWLDRPVQIGSITWAASLYPTIAAQNVRVSNHNKRLLAFSPSVEAEVDLFALFHRTLLIDNVTVTGGRLNLRGRGSSLNVVRLSQNVMRRQAVAPPRSSGLFTLQLKKLAVSQLTVTLTSSDRTGRPAVWAGDGKINLRPRFRRDIRYRVRLAGTSAPGERLEASGTLGKNSSVTVTGKEIPFEDIGVLVPRARPFDGRLAVEAAWKNSGSWKVDLNATGLRPRVLQSGLSATAQAHVESNKPIQITALVKDASSQLRLSGTLDVDGQTLQARAEGDRFQVEEASPWMEAFQTVSAAPAALPQFDKGWSGTISAKFGTVEFSSATLDNVDAEARFDPVRVEADTVTFRVWGGTVTAKGLYNRASETANVHAQGQISLGQFTSAGLTQSRVSGLATFGMDLSGPSENFVQSATGTATVIVDDGEITHMPALFKTFSSANLTSLVDKIKGDSERGYPFDHMEVHVVIDRGVLRVNAPLVIENKTMRVAFTGAVDLMHRTIDGSVLVQVLTVADEVIRSIPVVRGLLMGDQKSFTPIYAKVTGSLSDPDVDVVNGKTILGPVVGIFRHVLALPKRFWNQLTGKNKAEAVVGP